MKIPRNLLPKTSDERKELAVLVILAMVMFIGFSGSPVNECGCGKDGSKRHCPCGRQIEKVSKPQFVASRH
jgi:hypothetical protein